VNAPTPDRDDGGPGDEPRDATRGGVNGPALPGQRGQESPLSIDPPPFWGRWGRIYLLVAGLLAVETFVFWWLTRWAS
jgi:hypothetical protein